MLYTLTFLISQNKIFKQFFAHFQLACDAFCLDDDEAFLEATFSLQSESLTQQNVRLVEAKNEDTAEALSKCHNKKVSCPSIFGYLVRFVVSCRVINCES